MEFWLIVIYIVLFVLHQEERGCIGEYCGSIFGTAGIVNVFFVKNKSYAHQERLVYNISQLLNVFCSLNGLLVSA